MQNSFLNQRLPNQAFPPSTGAWRANQLNKNTISKENFPVSGQNRAWFLLFWETVLSWNKPARKTAAGRKNVIATLEHSLFEGQPDKALILKLTNVFLYVSVPLCFIDQHNIVWVIQSFILEPAAKYNIQSSAKQESVCSCVNDVVLHKTFQNL